MLACKCEAQNIKQSFKSADFVFIGNIQSVTETPSGFKTLQNFISNVKIEKVFKSENYDGFYVDQATLFTSQIRSCDYPFNKGRYLIFGYIDSDTGFIYSEHCLATKEISFVTQEDFKLLEKLNADFTQELKVKNTKPQELIELLEERNTPNRKINTLDRELSILQSENRNLKILIIGISIVFILVFVFFILKKKK